MNKISTTYKIKDIDWRVREEVDIIDVSLLMSLNIHEIRMIMIVNFMAPHKEIDDLNEEGPKVVKLKYEYFKDVFYSKNLFYKTINLLISKDIIKRTDIISLYELSIKYFTYDYFESRNRTKLTMFYDFTK